MNRDLSPHRSAPVEVTSPEEDATLLAIEALEAQSVNPHPLPWRPLGAREVKPVAPREAPVAPPVVTKINEPVIQIHTPMPKPPVVPMPITPTPAAPTPITVPPKAITTPPPKPEKPKRPATPAEAIADALANIPASTKRFQFFINQKPPRKPFIIVGVAVLIVGLVVVTYFAIR